MTRKLKAAGLFSGIGGFCLGFRQEGIETSWAVENDPISVATYEANIGPNKVVRKDGVPLNINDVSVSRCGLEPVDILHAGFPCQSFSVAGERKGFNDPRGQLFYEIIRLIKEFGEDRPAVLLLENSPNFKIGDGGSWFIELTNEIKQAGYWFRESNAIELDSYDYTQVPQKRRRLFMVAFATNKFKNGKFSLQADPHCTPKELGDFIDFEGSIDDNYYYLDAENRYFKMITEKMESSLLIRSEQQRVIYQLRKYLVREKEPNVCPTLTANMGNGGHNVPFIVDTKGLRKLTEYECLALQGFPSEFRFPDDVPRWARYQQVGNSVVPPLISLLAKSIKSKLLQETHQ